MTSSVHPIAALRRAFSGGSDLKQTARWLLVAMLGGLSLIALRFLAPFAASGLSAHQWMAYGYAFVTMLWAFGCFAAGLLARLHLRRSEDAAAGRRLRTGAAENGQKSASRAAALRPNSNLEDISDWLTKTLVGAGLTQLAKFPDSCAIPRATWPRASVERRSKRLPAP